MCLYLGDPVIITKIMEGGFIFFHLLAHASEFKILVSKIVFGLQTLRAGNACIKRKFPALQVSVCSNPKGLGLVGMHVICIYLQSGPVARTFGRDIDNTTNRV